MHVKKITVIYSKESEFCVLMDIPNTFYHPPRLVQRCHRKGGEICDELRKLLRLSNNGKIVKVNLVPLIILPPVSYRKER